MKKKNNSNSVYCGDWELGWGYGYNKIGKLTLVEDVFTWRGHCQGRHGQRGSIYFVDFKLAPEGSEYKIEYLNGQRGLPAWSELKKGIDQLLTNQKNLKLRLLTNQKNLKLCQDTTQQKISFEA